MEKLRNGMDGIRQIFQRRNALRFMIVHMLLGGAMGCMTSCSDDMPEPHTKPWDGDKNMDLSVAAGNNFYQYANGSWLAHTVLPKGWKEWGPWQIIQNDAEGKLRQFYQSTSDAQIQRYTLMAQDKLNRAERSADALRSLLREIHAASSRDRLLSAIASMQKAGYSPFFEVGVTPHEFNSRVFLPLLKVSTTYFDAQHYSNESFYAAYVHLLGETYSELFDEEKLAEALEMAEDALSVQMELMSAYHTPNARATSSTSILNLLEQCGIKTTCVYDPASNIDVANRLMLQGDLKKLRNYLAMHLVEQNAYLVSLEILQKWLDFEDTYHTESLFYKHHKLYDINTANAEDAWCCLNRFAPEFVGRHFTQKYVNTAKRNKVKGMAESLRTAYKERLRDSIAWMGEETRAAAIEKLNALVPLLLQPAAWLKCCDMQLNTENFCAATNQLRKLSYQHKLDLFGMPIANRYWEYVLHVYPLFEPICVYEPRMNAWIVTPAFAGEEFFDEQAPASKLYGTAGFRMARELVHGFDARGSQYNHTGALADWWKMADRTAYAKLTQELGGQYQTMELLPNMSVNGQLVSDEASADLGGLQIASQAFERDMRRRGVGKHTQEKERSQFYISFAQTLSKVTTDEYKAMHYQYSPVAYDEFRVQATVANVYGWYHAFGIQPEDRMYLPVSKRIRLW